jgi:hypothetical protein
MAKVKSTTQVNVEKDLERKRLQNIYTNQEWSTEQKLKNMIEDAILRCIEVLNHKTIEINATLPLQSHDQKVVAKNLASECTNHLKRIYQEAFEETDPLVQENKRLKLDLEKKDQHIKILLSTSLEKKSSDEGGSPKILTELPITSTPSQSRISSPSPVQSLELTGEWESQWEQEEPQPIGENTSHQKYDEQEFESVESQGSAEELLQRKTIANIKVQQQARVYDQKGIKYLIQNDVHGIPQIIKLKKDGTPYKERPKKRGSYKTKGQ